MTRYTNYTSCVVLLICVFTLLAPCWAFQIHQSSSVTLQAPKKHINNIPVPSSNTQQHAFHHRLGQSMRIGTASATYLSMSTAMSMSAETEVNLDEIESLAEQASESWSIAVSQFVNEADADAIEERIGNRADIGCFRIGGSLLRESHINGNDDDDVSKVSSRVRFVMTHPDVLPGLEFEQTEAEYCTILCIDQIQSAMMPKRPPRSNFWPHLFLQIGVDTAEVGNVMVNDETDQAYVVVSPKVVRQCRRILPKELRGVGITVSVLDAEDYVHVPLENGVSQDMELGELDVRSLKYQ